MPMRQPSIQSPVPDVCNQQTAGRSLISTDGDLHSHLRKILAHNITPRAIRHLEA
jgi:cytochrome P450